MKKTTFALTLSSFITLSTGAQALELLVVKNYDQAGNPEIWKKAKTDQVPNVLLGNEVTHSPGASYSSLFPKTFFQEDMFAVCHRNCADKDIFKIRDGEISSSDRDDWEVVEQSNVYFWMNKYFSFLDEKLNFRPEFYLKVFTNRVVKDETKGKTLKNNAFFNPMDITLSFLPASNNVLFSLLSGKVNRSGFDPSVIGHEASHYLFHHLFPNPINDEIGGLNEGFADYVANIFLDNPKVGMVMLHGKAMRDSSSEVDGSRKLKVYEPGMEVHDLGERVAYALWKTRELSNDKEEFDRLVVDAVIDLGKNPYSTVHDFKVKMVQRLSQVLDSAKLVQANNLWEVVFSGTPTKIADISSLKYNENTNSFIGFSEKTIAPDNMVRDMGIEKETNSNLTILQMQNLSATQTAILISGDSADIKNSYWVVVDLQKGNILGIYDLNKKLVTDSRDLKTLGELAGKAKKAPAMVKNFTDMVKQFSDLENGKGTFAFSYKVKDKSIEPANLVFNGSSVSGQKVRMQLKRKLLGGVVLGMPSIKSIDLYTAPVKVGSLQTSNGQTIVGYRITFETGMVTETILNKAPAQ